jgi:hypothetical protein
MEKYIFFCLLFRLRYGKISMRIKNLIGVYLRMRSRVAPGRDGRRKLPHDAVLSAIHIVYYNAVFGCFQLFFVIIIFPQQCCCPDEIVNLAI